MEKHLNILGIRGIPAAHGGFESFAAHFAPYMRDAGWHVTVYCQEGEGVSKARRWTDSWEGIERVHFDTRTKGALATIEFDLKCTLDVLKRPGVDLVLGYNTAIFTLIQRLAGRRVVMNMDGIEWKRQKWGRAAKAWFWLNEWIGANFCSTPIADHPEIARHLETRGCKRAVVIPYGSDTIESAPRHVLQRHGLNAGDYFISIARIEPENSILEIVEAFVAADTGRKLVILGKLEPEKNAYHARVKAAANKDVKFTGAIYEPESVRALRYHCLAYMHGHQVGGTNPSLVEALGAGSPVIAHDNRFNRWTAGEQGMFFQNKQECASRMLALHESDSLHQQMSQASRQRHQQAFTFEAVHEDYLKVINP
jgi:glycosyltransferase involved in cell wall biosynthesis